MKIYLNRRPKHGPWGGGAKTVNKLDDLLRKEGHEVVYRLEPGIDLLFCFDPRPNDFGENYHDLLQYKALHRAKIIQRVGDIGTHGKPELTEFVNFCLDKSDKFIFPSAWSKDKIKFSESNYEVIPNAPMKQFYEKRKKYKKISKIPKVVTHHWSTNTRKGFQYYREFDKYCQLTGGFEFHYIGQKPINCNLTNYIQPVDVNTLMHILPEFDIYLTASEEEAGANHVLEAMASGLPVVYKEDGGSIVEYCEKYGESYKDFSGLVTSLGKVTREYNKYAESVKNYESTNDQVVAEYYRIINEVMSES
tara:strand:+ start:1837 stop:2754 length:918 start_codon:yes stop_codon:yes gene_type:complete